MWAIARYDLHLSDEDFYALTPRQFDVLVDRFRYQREWTELLFGQLTSWVANTGFRSTEKPTNTKDFMPSQWSRREVKANSTRTRMTKKKRQTVLDVINQGFGRPLT